MSGQREELGVQCETSFVVSTDDNYRVHPTIILRERPAFNQEAFDVNYQLITPPKQGVKDRITVFANTECLTKRFWWQFAQSRFPILSWIQCYEWKNHLLSDIIAGITVSVLHISLGMAFASLAQLPPVTGLYVSFFSNLMYTFMGGGHHLAVCGTAVISVMIGEVVQRTLQSPNAHDTLEFTQHLSRNVTEMSKLIQHTEGHDAVTVATAITLVAGILQVITGCVKLGGVSVYLSDTMLSGFLMGASVHVFTSQLSTVFGITIPEVDSPLRIFKIIAHVIGRLPFANLATVLIFFGTLLFLAVTKFFFSSCVTIPFPLPVELFVILTGTLISLYMDFENVYSVAIVGYIPTGLPSFVVPSMWIVPSIAYDAIVICVVSYAITLSFGLVFSKKYGYKIESNQELIALGVINVFGSFFACVPTSVGMSRTLAQEAAGGYSLVTNFVASVILLLAILFIGPVFRCLPSCVLAAIVFIALRGMFSQLRQLHLAWAISFLEASLWIVAFLAVVLLDVGIGLGIGFLYSLLLTVFQTQWPYTCLLGRIPGTDIYLDSSKYQAAIVDDGVKIFHFGSFLYFVNKEYFKSELYRLSGFDPTSSDTRTPSKQVAKTPVKGENLQLMFNAECSSNYGAVKESLIGVGSSCNSFATKTKTNTSPSNVKSVSSPLHHIIIDASTWSYIDLPGIEVLTQVVNDYNAKGITVFIAGCQASICERLETSELYYMRMKHLIFPSIHDAFAYAHICKDITCIR